MAQLFSQTTVQSLLEPATTSSHLELLLRIKNELIGHEQKKELCVRLGFITPLVRLLHKFFESRETNTREEEEARLQATIILGSIAHGGPAYVVPLIEAGVAQALIFGLDISVASPKLTLATLRAFNTIADALKSATYHPHARQTIKASNTFSTYVSSRLVASLMHNILVQPQAQRFAEQQYGLVSSLISKTCRDVRHRNSLVEAMVLDALAARLAYYILNMEPFCEDAHMMNSPVDRHRAFLTGLVPVLDAIRVIISISRKRGLHLIRSPALQTIFGAAAERGKDQSAKQTLNDFLSMRNAASRYDFRNDSSESAIIDDGPLESPPPVSSYGFTKTASALYSLRHSLNPPLERLQERSDFLTNTINPAVLATASQMREEEESPLIDWLIFLAREQTGIVRLQAIGVLTMLYRAQLTSKLRDSSMAKLIVPLLVEMIDAPQSAGDYETRGDFMDEKRIIREQAPRILAVLILDNEGLQKAAVEARAIEKVANELKSAYSLPTLAVKTTPWTPEPQAKPYALQGDKSCQLGDMGLTEISLAQVKSREGALRALAAICLSDDNYKEKVLKSGIARHLVESLKPFVQMNPESHAGADSQNGANAWPEDLVQWDGNPSAVLIAACQLVRSLSRSVKLLRTSLLDAGIAMPVYELLKSQDIDVRTAAAGAICNLAMEFSPMRGPILEAGGLQILCEYAHSSHSELRLNAVWALRNIVYIADQSIKEQCLEQLGHSWLVKLVEDGMPPRDAESSDEHYSRASKRKHSNGDSLSSEPHSMVEGVADAIRQRDTEMLDESHENGLLSGRTTIHAAAQFLEMDSDDEKGSSQRHQNLAVQEQSLELIRNLTCGEGSADLIDFLFTRLGEDRLFELLTNKVRLRSATSGTHHRYGSSGDTGRYRQSQANLLTGTDGKPATTSADVKIITAVCYILIHIAQGSASQRQTIIKHTEILKCLLGMLSHPHPAVRVCTLWIVNNLTALTSKDDKADEEDCRVRALELRKLGYLAKLESMEHDHDLDVKERLKTALHQMRSLCNGY